jgi:hypothetical protein
LIGWKRVWRKHPVGITQKDRPSVYLSKQDEGNNTKKQATDTSCLPRRRQRFYPPLAERDKSAVAIQAWWRAAAKLPGCLHIFTDHETSAHCTSFYGTLDTCVFKQQLRRRCDEALY